MTYLFVFLGGGAGCLLRFLLSSVAHWPVVAGQFPLKTFVVNMAGCFLIGLLSAALSIVGGRPEVKNLLVAGFCGGFTTFSTFSREALDLLNGGFVLIAISYALLSVAVGVGLVAAGYAIASKMVG